MRRKTFVLALIVAVLITLTVGTLSASASGYGCRKHYIQWGETLYSIGRAYNVAPYAIAAYNGIANPNYIQGGRWLCVPYGPPYPGYYGYYGYGYYYGRYDYGGYYGGYPSYGYHPGHGYGWHGDPYWYRDP